MVRRIVAWVLAGLVTAWIAIGCLAMPGIAFAETDSGADSDPGGSPGTSQVDPPRSTTKAEPSTTDPGSGATAAPKADAETDTDTDTADTPDVDSPDVDPEATAGRDADTDAPDPAETVDPGPDTVADPATTAETPAADHASTVDHASTAPSPEQRASADPTASVELRTTADVAENIPDTVESGPADGPADRSTPETVPAAEPDPAAKTVIDTGTGDDAVNPDTRSQKSEAVVALAVADTETPTPSGSPNLINIIGTLFFAVFDFISQILEGPPAVPARLEDQVTVGRSKLEIDCGDGYSAYADWYFPTSEVPPTGLIYFQHGWPGRAGFYNETAAELAVRTNSIVLAPSITGNFMACDACNVTSDQMHYAIAKLFSGDWSALTISASAAAGHDIVLPRSYILAGHSAGGLLAAGAAGYAAQIAELSGRPLQLAGVLLWDTSASTGQVGRALAKIPEEIPVLSLSAEPSSLNNFSDLDAVLDAARPDEFIGLRLVGATHGDFSQSTSPLVQAGMNLFGGQPTAVNTQAVLAISQGWIADMFAGTVYDPMARTGVYGDRGTSVQITTAADTATADVLPGAAHQWTLGDYISVLLQNSLALLASSPCAADVDALLAAEFGGAASTADPVGACHV